MEKVPQIIRQCLTFLQSDALFLTLSDLTGLALHHLAHKNVDLVSGAEEDSDSSDSCEQQVGKSNATAISNNCNDSAKEEQTKPETKRLKLDTDNEDTPNPSDSTNMETDIISSDSSTTLAESK